MKQINRYLSYYILISFPLVLSVPFWAVFQSQREVLETGSMFLYFLREILSFHLIAWVSLLVYLLLALVFSTGFRDETLARLMRMKETDERESSIAAKSTRFTFFATLALSLFLLFYSTINISLVELPEDRIVNGHTKELSIGFSFEWFDHFESKSEGKNVLFTSKPYLLSKHSILLILIFWQLGTFYLASRKMMEQE